MDGPLVIMIMPFLFSGVIRYISCVITFFKKKTTYITLHYQSMSSGIPKKSFDLSDKKMAEFCASIKGPDQPKELNILQLISL